MSWSQTRTRLLLFAIIIAVLVGGYLTLARMGTLALLENEADLQQWIQELGILGPLAIIGLMTLAVVVSPIPSAPIAMAAGAAYGHTEGAVYVLLGAELGAISAFFIARLLGLATLQKWLDPRLIARLQGSQNAMMGILFVTRLLPFISFDMVSYAAGVTPLRFWRFAVATLAGIIPASFLLAYFGAELAGEEGRRIALTLLLLGGISLLITITHWLTHRR